MKKFIALLLALVCMFGLSGCSVQKQYGIKIIVPSQHQGEFIFSEQEISPRKSQLDIKSIDIPKDAEFILKPVDTTDEITYECTNFPYGESMLIEVEKGTWYKLGISMENPTDEDITVVFHVENVKVRIE